MSQLEETMARVGTSTSLDAGLHIAQAAGRQSLIEARIDIEATGRLLQQMRDQNLGWNLIGPVYERGQQESERRAANTSVWRALTVVLGSIRISLTPASN
jgi:hypothetical protein